jgi:hypothetical protein
MKVIKLLACAISIASFCTNTAQAQAESNPKFCQIHSGNVNSYILKSNLFDEASNTPFLPFVQNRIVYTINSNLLANTLFYTAISDNKTIIAFELKGKLNKFYIGDRKINIGNKNKVIQYIVQDETGTYAGVLGYCINNVFVEEPEVETYLVSKLPLETQTALNEARLGVFGGQISNMLR